MDSRPSESFWDLVELDGLLDLKTVCEYDTACFYFAACPFT